MPSTENLEAALAIADEVAARFLAWAAPLRFGVAETATEREAAFRLRYRVVVEEGWAIAESLPEGMERDAYDQDAIQVVGWDGQSMVATNRIVLPAPGQRLPTEDAYDLLIEPQGQVADVGRAVVAREHRDLHHRVMTGLLGQSWRVARAHGYYYLCAAAVPAVIRLFRIIGYQVAVLGEPRLYWGEERLPIRFDIPESAPGLSKHLASAPNHRPR